MEIKSINPLKVDRFCDYIPGVSTVTNLISLFQKCVVIPFKQKATVSKSHYYAYLQQKSFFRCVILLVPVLGNIAVAVYDIAKNRNSPKEDRHTAAQPVTLSAHSFFLKGIAIDICRQLGKGAKNWVVGKKEAKTIDTVQGDYSQANVMAGGSEEKVRQLTAKAYGKHAPVSNPFEQASFKEAYCHEHTLTGSFIALYPALQAKCAPIKVLASAVNPHLSGTNSQVNIQSTPVIHYNAALPSRLSNVELYEKLKELLKQKCSHCLKDLIAQGHKLLKEVEEQISLQGVFYLVTAYELYRTLNVQEYRFDKQALNEYLDRLEERLLEGESLLHYFAVQGNLSIFIYLFEERLNLHCQLNVLAGKTAKEPPLHVAIRAGFIPIVQLLLDQGADVKELGSSQNNALHYACQSQKDCIEIIKLLLERDPSLLQACNTEGQTPLHLAALTGNAKIAKYLLNQIAGRNELDQRDEEGNTPLHLAAREARKLSHQAAEQYAETAVALIKKGFSLTIANSQGKTPLALIFENAALTEALVRVGFSSQMLISRY